MGIVLKYSQRFGMNLQNGEVEFDANGLADIRVSYPSPDVVTFCDSTRMVSFRDLDSWELDAGSGEKVKKGKDSLTLVLDEDDVLVLDLALKNVEVSEALRRPYQALMRLITRYKEGS